MLAMFCEPSGSMDRLGNDPNSIDHSKRGMAAPASALATWSSLAAFNSRSECRPGPANLRAQNPLGRHPRPTATRNILKPAPLERSLSPKLTPLEACVDPSPGRLSDLSSKLLARGWRLPPASDAPFTVRDSTKEIPDESRSPASGRPQP